MKKLWGGRFKERTEKVVEKFTSSLSYDVRLWRHDIEGSVAHVKMLGRQKIIPRKDVQLILKGLAEIREEIESGRFRFQEHLEDVHMNIEHALIRKIGPVGGKLHTARSRNDQVALDVRLYLREEIALIRKELGDLQRDIVATAEKHIDFIMPGFTHLQKAQPVLLAHHLLAYNEMLERDSERFSDCLGRVNVMPLGSAALAGTTLPIDRKYVAGLLGFPRISENSMDAVADRDFILEFMAASSVLMTHLSRFAEEMIIWNSDEFGYVELPDAFTTGSSIMPQKKNPDVLELIRGRTGRVYGHLMAFLTVMKGLPLAYNRDMQEDKEPLFDTVDTVRACLQVLHQMVPKVRFSREKLERSAGSGFPTATDLAEYLVRKGMPFRDAHKVTGEVVRYCIDGSRNLEDLDIEEFKRFSGLIGKDIKHYITPQASIDGKRSYGGTSKKMVLARIRKLKAKR